MNIYLQRLSLILCSGFFFPVSCTIGTVASLPIIQSLDARDIVKGDMPHADFFVLTIPVANENKIGIVHLDKLDEYTTANPEASFYLTNKKGSLSPNDYTLVTYEVLQQSDKQQIIEATLKDDDGHVLSRYEVVDEQILPLYSEGYYNSYAFIALRNGIIVAFTLYSAGRIISFYFRRRPKVA